MLCARRACWFHMLTHTKHIHSYSSSMYVHELHTHSYSSSMYVHELHIQSYAARIQAWTVEHTLPPMHVQTLHFLNRFFPPISIKASALMLMASALMLKASAFLLIDAHAQNLLVCFQILRLHSRCMLYTQIYTHTHTHTDRERWVVAQAKASPAQIKIVGP